LRKLVWKKKIRQKKIPKIRKFFSRYGAEEAQAIMDEEKALRDEEAAKKEEKKWGKEEDR
jgi:hypothetical protein